MQLTDLEWNTQFTSTILLHDSIVPNSYGITIKFNSNTDNITNQNRAFDRIKYFFQSMLNNGLIMNYKNNSNFWWFSTVVVDFKIKFTPVPFKRSKRRLERSSATPISVPGKISKIVSPFPDPFSSCFVVVVSVGFAAKNPQALP